MRRALIAEGGGMRGAFTAGFLARLRSLGIDHSFFDYYAGSSAGACTLAYFLTDQVEEGMRIWTQYLPNGFMKCRGVRPYNDMRYLEKIFREIEPFSIERLAARTAKMTVVLSNPRTLDAEYFCLNLVEDPVAVLVAGTAMPFFSGPSFVYGLPYYDGGLTSAVPLRYGEFYSKADEIWVLLTSPPGHRRSRFIWSLAAFLAGGDDRARRLIANRPERENRELEAIERRDDLIVVRPDQRLPAHWRETNKDKLRATMEIGERTAEKFVSRF